MNTFLKKDIIGTTVTISFLGIIVLMTWFALHKIEVQTKTNARESLQTVLQTTHEALYIWISQRKKDIKKLATEKKLQRLTRQLLTHNTQKSDPQFNKALNEMRAFVKPVIEKNQDQGFFIITPDRHNIASMRNSNMHKKNLVDVQYKLYLDRVFQGETVFVSTIQSDVPLNNTPYQTSNIIPTMFVITPVLDTNENIIAALALRIDPAQNFTRIIQLGRLGESGETYAFDHNAILISESRFDHQLKRIGLTQPGNKGMLSIRISDPGKNLLTEKLTQIPPDKQKLTKMAASAISGHTDYDTEGYRDYRGVNVMGAWLWDDDIGFGLTTEIDVQEALQSFTQTRLIIIALLMTTVLLSIFLYLILLKARKEIENRLELKVHKHTRELEQARTELETKNYQLEILATTDSLTSLANRRSFDRQLQDEWRRCARDKKPVSLLMIDVDYFKSYNDSYGHQQGDSCLKTIAQCLNNAHVSSRPGDLLARYGGEEFAIILSDTNNDGAIKLAQKIQHEIDNAAIPHTSSNVTDVQHVTLSIGVATDASFKNKTPMTLLNEADQMLYQAKLNGRNNIASESPATVISLANSAKAKEKP